MADRPIIFSAPMIKALLAGTKSQTRRTLKPQPHLMSDTALSYIGVDGKGHEVRIRPGDRLWVKERIAIVPSSAYRMSEGVQQTIDPSDPDNAAIYRAGWDRSLSIRFRSSLHMPRWASRITLLVDDVRVERLQDISEEDAMAEGITRIGAEYIARGSKDWDRGPNFYTIDIDGVSMNDATAVDVYRRLWEWINGEGSWQSNPFVVAYAFRVVIENIDYIGKAAA